jgi:hypothetical protein
MSYETEDRLIWNAINKPSDYKAHNRIVQFEWTPKCCWWIIPTIEINTDMKEVGIYILCLGIYITWNKNR